MARLLVVEERRRSLATGLRLLEALSLRAATTSSAIGYLERQLAVYRDEL